MTVDDLNAPLGTGKPKRRRLTIPAVVPRAIAGALAACVLVFALWALLVDDPFGGEPVAVVPVQLHAPAASKTEPAASAAQANAAAPAQTATTAPGAKTVTIIDGISGKRQDVVIGDAAQSPAGRSVEEKLIESSPQGAIPIVGPDGARAADAYARPVKGTPTGPRVAIMVGGLGVSASTTGEALAKLPPAVTLGFIPYGQDLARLVARARGEGREIVLQVPMEPFDYPDNDAGPQTLLTSLPPEQNLDRLHWAMSRFQGYVGIANYMGARFTAAEQALGPVLRDAGKRGLIYLDDGTSARSLTSQIAGGANMPFAKANIVLDATPTPAEIDNALAKLESIARERGVAVGVASALPASIDRIAHWAKAAAGRGIVLVPISAVASKPKST
ncbi:MAG: divergent polysaccharide deacetylase family protein [Hyphomicrobiales bacterium]|nr:divergent polysaccharide deacetylase family protein [Hyphomicrobiales bacterium]MBV8825665.1 divergent polysaccharide deacetylase family protein [Hyphomicrobiales bacterium]MBV9427495.1 divergent polysaccharide deacetylase family protein [Bradyrhizobiaceae bacterium]